MTRMLMHKVILIFILAVAMFSAAQAEYVIGIDDVLQVSFWQTPTLDQQVVVNADGKVTLSVIGEITAAGLTTAQLSRKIVEQVSRFNRDISQATVVVSAYNSQTVFVEGEVVTPGRYAREIIPDIWTIIKEMGGATPAGDLTQVRLVRGGAVDPGTVITVDVLAAVRARFHKIAASSSARYYPSTSKHRRSTFGLGLVAVRRGTRCLLRDRCGRQPWSIQT
ncbi:MAG: polysaccharide biosynthesis/export family protein [bacterium]|nr:polysaccharide biosynthesis/export family protein [bacterium]